MTPKPSDPQTPPETRERTLRRAGWEWDTAREHFRTGVASFIAASLVHAASWYVLGSGRVMLSLAIDAVFTVPLLLIGGVSMSRVNDCLNRGGRAISQLEGLQVSDQPEEGRLVPLAMDTFRIFFSYLCGLLLLLNIGVAIVTVCVFVMDLGRGILNSCAFLSSLVSTAALPYVPLPAKTPAAVAEIARAEDGTAAVCGLL